MNELIKKLVLNPDDGKFYIIIEKTAELVRLAPLADLSQQVVLYEPAPLLYLQNITDIKRQFNGLRTGSERFDNGTGTDAERLDNGTGTDAERNRNGTGTDEQPRAIGYELEPQQEVIGAGKVNLKKFSAESPAEIVETARKVEALLDRALAGTNKKTTIENLMRLHKTAKDYAIAGNIFKLKQVETRLRGIINKQQAIKTSEQTTQKKIHRKQLIIKIAVSLFCVFAGSGFLILKKRVPAESQLIINLHDDNNNTTSTFSPTPLQLAFKEYEQETGAKLYPYGRECIAKAARRLGIENDKSKIKKLIYQNLSK